MVPSSMTFVNVNLLFSFQNGFVEIIVLMMKSRIVNVEMNLGSWMNSKLTIAVTQISVNFQKNFHLKKTKLSL